MNRVGKALELINNRLPKTYPLVKVKIYSTVYSMGRAIARDLNWDYNYLCDYSDNHFRKVEKSKQDYINSKYYKHISYSKHRRECFSVTAYSGEPIFINLQNTCKHTVKNYVFLLLHELAHNYYAIRKPKQRLNERLCDMFAIRWTKKFIKEGLIR